MIKYSYERLNAWDEAKVKELTSKGYRLVPSSSGSGHIFELEEDQSLKKAKKKIGKFWEDDRYTDEEKKVLKAVFDI